MARFCTNCGKEAAIDTVYCCECGQRLKTEVVEKESALPPEPKNCPLCGGGPLYPNEGIDGKTYFCGKCKKDITVPVREWQQNQQQPESPVLPVRVFTTPTVDTNVPPASAPILVQVQKQKVEVPPSVNRWSWPAFLFGWVWAWGTGLYIWPWIVLGILVIETIAWPLMVITIPGYFGLYIYFGICGNRLLYQTGRFQSVEHFLEVERKWMKAFWVLLAIMVFLIIVLAALLTQNYVVDHY